MKTTPKPESIGEQIQSLLDRLEMTRRDLARESKLSLATIEKTLADDGAPSYRTQIAIEFAFGQPLWSSPEHFERAKEVKKLLGFVPQIESIKKLKACASRLRIKDYRSATSKPELTNLILRELAARAKRKQEIYAQMDADFNPKKFPAP